MNIVFESENYQRRYKRFHTKPQRKKKQYTPLLVFQCALCILFPILLHRSWIVKIVSAARKKALEMEKVKEFLADSDDDDDDDDDFVVDPDEIAANPACYNSQKYLYSDAYLAAKKKWKEDKKKKQEEEKKKKEKEETLPETQFEESQSEYVNMMYEKFVHNDNDSYVVANKKKKTSPP